MTRLTFTTAAAILALLPLSACGASDDPRAGKPEPSSSASPVAKKPTEAEADIGSAYAYLRSLADRRVREDVPPEEADQLKDACTAIFGVTAAKFPDARGWQAVPAQAFGTCDYDKVFFEVELAEMNEEYAESPTAYGWGELNSDGCQEHTVSGMSFRCVVGPYLVSGTSRYIDSAEAVAVVREGVLKAVQGWDS